MTKNSLTVQQEQLTALVERVTFHSEESGFCVIRGKTRGQRDLVTIVGSTASIAPGESIECSGFWQQNPTHGLQFQAVSLRVILPTTLDGLEKYLASGIIKGVGQQYAKRLIKAFGLDLFKTIETTPERLHQVAGIGKKRAEDICHAWKDQQAVRDLMIFLQSNGVGTARAQRIFKMYGDQAIAIIQANPYRLALDIQGIGFKTADSIAQRLGIAHDSTQRAEAGVLHVLQSLCENGHCAIEVNQLQLASSELLKISNECVMAGLQALITSKKIIGDQIEEQHCYYPAALYYAEKGVAQQLCRLQSDSLPWEKFNIATAIPWVEKKTGLKLSDTQKLALASLLQHKISIVTGGPGVGKTTLIKSVITILAAKKIAIALAAPTGRAAKRLTETTGMAAKTIHRLLEYSPRTQTYKFTLDNPLDIDLLILDETSMLDLTLAYHLLKALPTKAAVLFVGDIDQLPSVGSGAVLADCIASNCLPTIRLTEIFRQGQCSQIITNAHRINQGLMPSVDNSAGDHHDFYTLYCEEQEHVLPKLMSLVTTRLPAYLNCDPVQDIQILTPMNRGSLGAQQLNIELQKILNPNSSISMSNFGRHFCLGDKVMQLANNYDKNIFNGDIGFIVKINVEDQTLNVLFDSEVISYQKNELDELTLAYAITIHKSQGSEFPVIILPITVQHYLLLARNLLYTAVTRGKKMVILLGQKKAVAMAINNNKATKRLTHLAARIQNAYAKA